MKNKVEILSSTLLPKIKSLISLCLPVSLSLAIFIPYFAMFAFAKGF